MNGPSSHFKSPKAAPRRATVSGEAPRQVHFESHFNGLKEGRKSPHSANTSQLKTPPSALKTPKKTESSTSTGHPDANKNTQPDSFPALGPPPDGSGFPGGEWHTSADPTQSLASGFSLHPPPPQPGFTSGSPYQQPHVTYIGQHGPGAPQHFQLQQPPVQVNMAADYSNTAPPPTGLNFQPPVPDTTYGPMSHTYVPRYDGAPWPGVHVGLTSVPQASLPATISYPAPVINANVQSSWHYRPYYTYPSGYVYYASPPEHIFNAAVFDQPAMGAVPVNQPGYVYAQHPPMLQQPVHVQPVMMNGQAYYPAGAPHFQGVPGAQPVMGAPPVFAGNAGQHPEVTGYGRTPNEEVLRQVQFAHSNKLFESQDFKPADDDPSRFYFVREVDGNWTQRNRFSIDHMGDSRWYVTDEGWFYAVRLPS